MLDLGNAGTRLCDGLFRREFLRIGGLGLAGLSLPQLLLGRLNAGAGGPRAKSVIQLIMWGGPAHQDTLDLNPTPRRAFAPSSNRSILPCRACAFASTCRTWPAWPTAIPLCVPWHIPV